MLKLVVALALTAPVDFVAPDAETLLSQDDQLLEISRRLADIDQAYDFVDARYTGDNPYPWERFPHKPTLRDRKRALRAAREKISRGIVAEWDP